MTEKNWDYCLAIDLIKRIKTEETPERYIDRHKAFDIAIKALEEIQQYRVIGTLDEFKSLKENWLNKFDSLIEYREIGTVEECRSAVEKQIAKKPPVINRPNIFVKVPVCPNCSTQEHYQPIYGKAKYCSNCGQKLDLDN